MRILVTGANGQLGNEMRDLAVKYAQHTYFFTDVQELDICDAQAVQAFVAENGIELIVNCAAYTAVDKAEDNADLCDRLNHLAPAGLADAAERVGAALIHVSTDYVFDGTAHVPYTEEVAPCPNSVYGRTKLAGEREVMARCRRAMIIRTAWLYSEYGNNFVKTMLRLGRERETLGVVFDQIGTPTYAADLAEAIHRLAGISTCKVSPLHTDEYPAKAPRPHYSVLDKTKIKRTLGIDIPHWEESLARCVARLEGDKNIH